MATGNEALEQIATLLLEAIATQRDNRVAADQKLSERLSVIERQLGITPPSALPASGDAEADIKAAIERLGR